jgi:hypothetical protein
MGTDATIVFAGFFLLGVAGFILHWWLGRDERADATGKGPQPRSK